MRSAARDGARRDPRARRRRHRAVQARLGLAAVASISRPSRRFAPRVSWHTLPMPAAGRDRRRSPPTARRDSARAAPRRSRSCGCARHRRSAPATLAARVDDEMLSILVDEADIPSAPRRLARRRDRTPRERGARRRRRALTTAVASDSSAANSSLLARASPAASNPSRRAPPWSRARRPSGTRSRSDARLAGASSRSAAPRSRHRPSRETRLGSCHRGWAPALGRVTLTSRRGVGVVARSVVGLAVAQHVAAAVARPVESRLGAARDRRRRAGVGDDELKRHRASGESSSNGGSSTKPATAGPLSTKRPRDSRTSKSPRGPRAVGGGRPQAHAREAVEAGGRQRRAEVCARMASSRLRQSADR